MASMGGVPGQQMHSGRTYATEWNVHLVVGQLVEDIHAALADDRSSSNVLEGTVTRLENLLADLTGEVRPSLGPTPYLPEGYAEGAR